MKPEKLQPIAYQLSIASSSSSPFISNVYRNTESLCTKKIEDIPAENLLIAEQYFFDIEELTQYIFEQMEFLNPYTKTKFSELKINELLKHPKIQETISQWENTLKEQKNLRKKVSPKILKKIKEQGEIMFSDWNKNSNYLNTALAAAEIDSLLSNLDPESKTIIANYVICYELNGIRRKCTIGGSLKGLNETCGHETGDIISRISDDMLHFKSSEKTLAWVKQLKEHSQEKRSLFSFKKRI